MTSPFLLLRRSYYNRPMSGSLGYVRLDVSTGQQQAADNVESPRPGTTLWHHDPSLVNIIVRVIKKPETYIRSPLRTGGPVAPLITAPAISYVTIPCVKRKSMEDYGYNTVSAEAKIVDPIGERTVRSSLVHPDSLKYRITMYQWKARILRNSGTNAP